MDLIFLLVLSPVVINGASLEESYLEEESERRDIDMGELGIFHNILPPYIPYYEREFNPLPDTREEIGTEFRFFAPGTAQKVVKNPTFQEWDVAGSGFKADAKTVFITHGYLGGNAVWAVQLKDALLKKESLNVFIVDWTNGHGPIYEQTVANIRVVGAEIGLFIQKLKKATNLNPQNVHLIGHSLGAHASGYAGKWVQDRDGKEMIGRITGLDPAGPYFNHVIVGLRLDYNDASFVDVIHTNWAANRLQGFGLQEPIGHFDFYPNGGEDQPGCPTAGQVAGNILDGVSYYSSPLNAAIGWLTGNQPDIVQISKSITGISCSHGRAYEYFIASIEDKDCEFQALQCSSWEDYVKGVCGTCQNHKCIVMGYYADRYKRKETRGNPQEKFFLRTTPNAPFCLSV